MQEYLQKWGLMQYFLLELTIKIEKKDSVKSLLNTFGFLIKKALEEM
jgi:hypothetical protein